VKTQYIAGSSSDTEHAVLPDQDNRSLSEGAGGCAPESNRGHRASFPLEMVFALTFRPASFPARRRWLGTRRPRGQNEGTSKPQAPAWVRPWLAYKQLTTRGFPRRFPIVQFPNLPLIVAFLAGQVGGFVRGSEHSFARSVSYLAMTIWAYGELAQGVNWFRHLLGLAYVIILVIRVAHALQV
jgi:hypothetical protein